MAAETLSRRHFLRGKFLSSLQSEPQNRQGMNAVRPPWALTEALFTEQCTRCGDCVAACETQILVKGDGDFPEVRFKQGECTLCGDCVKACEQPIFRPLEQRPWFHQVEIQPHCLAMRNITCRTCQDSCPQSAVKFRFKTGGMAVPQLDLERCNGCGACIAACPGEAITIKIINDITHDE